MRPADVERAERLSDDAFAGLAAEDPTGAAPARRRPPARSAAWVERTHHVLRTDPAGCWVAEADDGSMAGFATSIVREGTWVLCTYAVRPDVQGLGLGRALLETARRHGRHCLRAMLASSSGQAAVRRYRLAGFDLHPQMVLAGRLDRALLPVVERVREGTASDVDLLDSVDRRTRGAAHGSDHGLLGRSCRLMVADGTGGTGAQGYTWVDDRGVALLAATDRRTATRLLWAALAAAGEAPGNEVAVPHVTAANQWALDVAVAARLGVRLDGYLAVSGMRPPAPYVHHGSLL